jgi:membrane fusion protein, multidrug efflux system
VSITNGLSGNEVIALLPGSFAPQIGPGMTMVLTIDGYQDTKEELPISAVNFQIVGPDEAARFVGHESANVVSVTGSVLLVRCPLASDYFTSEHGTFAFHDGMSGQAKVSVRKEPLIVTLIPGLRKLKGKPSDLINDPQSLAPR